MAHIADAFDHVLARVRRLRGGGGATVVQDDLDDTYQKLD